MSPNLAESGREAPGLSKDPVVMPTPKRPSVGYVVERGGPLLAGIGCGFVGWHFGYMHLLSVSWGGTFLDRILTMTAIIIGYSIAVVAILPATDNKYIVQKFKSWGYFRILVSYFGSAIWSAFSLLALSIIPFTLSYAVRQHRTVDGVFSAVWWFAFCHCEKQSHRHPNLQVYRLRKHLRNWLHTC